MEIRDRIKELRRIPAKDLRQNPKNWRTHPAAQQEALRGVLSEVGYADALLTREGDDGALVLIDGHLRAETTPDAIVPVLVLDVDEAEAAKILATLDPLAAMAEADTQKLDSLLREIDTGSDALASMLADLQPPPVLDLGEPPESIKQTVEAIESVKSQRRKSNESVANERDTEKYLVIVYRSRELKEAALNSLGLPMDERYIPADSITLKARYTVKPMQTNGRKMKAASAKKSGATG